MAGENYADRKYRVRKTPAQGGIDTLINMHSAGTWGHQPRPRQVGSCPFYASFERL